MFSGVSKLRLAHSVGKRSSAPTLTKLSQMNGSTAPNHKLLMIPGPTEFSTDILNKLAEPSESHVSPVFIETFGATLQNLRPIFCTSNAQPFVLSGGGTLGWDAISASLVEPEERAVVINTGYFSDSFADCLSVYGAQVTNVRAPQVGDVAALGEIEKTLIEAKQANQPIKLLTITQVDTSTGVLSNVKAISDVVKTISPSTLIAVDGVCSFGGEEFRFDEWGVDAAMTASQKAMGVPPGLAIVLLSERAVDVLNSRFSPVLGYYANLQNWLPIMKAYENRAPAYFSTPNVNCIAALRLATDMILEEGLDNIFARHQTASQAFRQGIKSLGLEFLVVREEICSNLMTTIKYPAGINGPDLLKAMAENDVTIAGGLHKDAKATYFRIGHMGVSAQLGVGTDVYKTMGALENSLATVGFEFEKGAGLKCVSEGEELSK